MPPGSSSGAIGTFTNCGPGVAKFRLDFSCDGPACSSLTGNKLFECKPDRRRGGSSLACSNKVECPKGIENFRSDFNFTIPEPDPVNPGAEADPYPIVKQQQQILVPDCKSFRVESDGTAGGTKSSDMKTEPNCGVKPKETPSGGTKPKPTKPVFVEQPSDIKAGSKAGLPRYNTPKSTLLLAFFLFVVMLVPGAQAYNPRRAELQARASIRVRAVSDKVRSFANQFDEALSEKANAVGANGKTFAQNLVADVVSSVCGAFFKGQSPGEFTPVVVEDCLKSIYGGDKVSDPGVQFLAVFGASLLCDYTVSEAYPVAQEFFPDGCDGLIDLTEKATASESPSLTPAPTIPLASSPAVPNPVVSNPPLSNSPVWNPPVSNPPASNPPASNPPASNPPASNPPASNPPASNPPASNPPPSNPPASNSQPPVSEPTVPQPPVSDAPVSQLSGSESVASHPTASVLSVSETPIPESPASEPAVSAITESSVSGRPLSEPPVSNSLPPPTQPPESIPTERHSEPSESPLTVPPGNSPGSRIPENPAPSTSESDPPPSVPPVVIPSEEPSNTFTNPEFIDSATQTPDTDQSTPPVTIPPPPSTTPSTPPLPPVTVDEQSRPPSRSNSSTPDTTITPSPPTNIPDITTTNTTTPVPPTSGPRCTPGSETPDYCIGVGCTDLQTDAANCGTCGTQCQNGCVNGECTCPPGHVIDNGICYNITIPERCPSSKIPDYCVDVGCTNLQRDSENCGLCGRRCQHECDNGECICPQGQVADNGICYNITVPDDCPAGSRFDPYTEECRPCFNGEYFLDFCPEAGCVDLMYNDTSCGSCGHVCQNSTCFDGQCVSCPEGQFPDSGSDCRPMLDPGPAPNTTTVTETNMRETTTSETPYTTDTTSTPTPSCNADIFQYSCPDVAGCTDLRFDNQNCGECGHVCYESECYQSQCISCPYGRTPETGSNCFPVDRPVDVLSETNLSTAIPSITYTTESIPTTDIATPHSVELVSTTDCEDSCSVEPSCTAEVPDTTIVPSVTHAQESIVTTDMATPYSEDFGSTTDCEECTPTASAEVYEPGDYHTVSAAEDYGAAIEKGFGGWW